MTTKIMPIHNCRECPMFNEEPQYYECTLSNMRLYEKDDSAWAEKLDEFCPLATVDEIIDKAYEGGKNYAITKDEIKRQIRLSTKQVEWFTPQDFFDKFQHHKDKTVPKHKNEMI